MKFRTGDILKLKLILPFLLYLMINSLFVLKYTSRITCSNEYVNTLIYVVIVTLITFLYISISIRKQYYEFLFWVISILIFTITVYLNISVAGKDVNVDRWSAMQMGIEALLKGEYPYSAVDHMGGRTSNLPTLIFIGIPFYLMGNVGYLQSFSLLVFCLILYISFKEYKEKLFGLLLLVLSPSYLWEIYVKSDLMSNFILVLLFLVIVRNKSDKGKMLNTFLISIGSAAAILTRLTAIIPVSLLLFKQFYYFPLKDKMKFLVTAIITSIVFLCICFWNVGGFEHFMRYNPFELQNRYLPILISFAIILMSFVYSFKVNDLASLMKSSALFLFLPVFVSFLLNISRNGFFSSVFSSSFDISYFNIIMPFLLMVILFEYKILLPAANERISEADAKI